MSKPWSVAEAKARLPSLLRQVERGAKVPILRRGRPVAVLVSARDYDRLAREAPSFWDALQDFRKTFPLLTAGEVAGVLSGVRDRGAGRRVRL